MNKHIETLLAFKYGTKRIAKDICEEVKNIGFALLAVFKGICFVLLMIVIWLIGLVLVIALPIGTKLRLKAESENEKAVRKAVDDYYERMTCLHNKGETHDQHLNR